MNKIKEIILAYAIKFNPTDEQKEIVETSIRQAGLLLDKKINGDKN